TNAVDRFITTIGAVAQAKPDVLDKFDSDKWADVYSEMLGVDPELIVADDKVALIRQQRAQQQAQMQQAAMAQQAASAAKDMSQVNTQEKNGLTDLMNQFSGYTIPQGGS
ncbi:phage head-tail adapter protein, partial [bacterium]|nr:phage head-tail adapter protein [bacterium]